MNAAIRIIAVSGTAALATCTEPASGAFSPLRNWTFNTGAEGWDVISMPYFQEADPARTPAPWDPFNGANGTPGSLRVGDLAFQTAIATPRSYRGSLVWAYDPKTERNTGARWFLQIRSTSGGIFDWFMFNCGTDSLVGSIPIDTAGGLSMGHHFIHESRFTRLSTGGGVTRAEFLSLLSHVTAAYVLTEFDYNTSLDDTTLDTFTFPSPTLAGDANVDGTVNFSDLLSLAQNYGRVLSANVTPDVCWTYGDSNADNRVNFDDLLALAQNYGQSSPAGDVLNASAPVAAASLVPEPASGLVLAIGGAALMARRRPTE